MDMNSSFINDQRRNICEGIQQCNFDEAYKMLELVRGNDPSGAEFQAGQRSIQGIVTSICPPLGHFTRQ